MISTVFRNYNLAWHKGGPSTHLECRRDWLPEYPQTERSSWVAGQLTYSVTVFNQAWDYGITTENCQGGFRGTGLFPFNRNAIPANGEFAPSNTSERKLPAVPLQTHTVSATASSATEACAIVDENAALTTCHPDMEAQQQQQDAAVQSSGYKCHILLFIWLWKMIQNCQPVMKPVFHSKKCKQLIIHLKCRRVQIMVN